LSERPLTTKGENRRDLPLGVGTSVSLHVVVAICIFFAAAAYFVSSNPAFSPQSSRNVIIQTLTRTPHIATQVLRITQPRHPEKPIRIGVSQPTHVHRMVEHTRGAIAAHSAAPGIASAPASAARQQPQTASASSASATSVTASANGTAASGVNGAGGSGPGGSGDSTPQNGGGSVWTDKPASGGTLGDKIPDATRPYCTPGRGGFLNRG
jgi:hypothetical protein